MTAMATNDAPLKTVLTGPVLGDEPRFLDDLPKDNLVGAIVALTAEVYMLRERLQTLEAELTARGVLPAGGVEQHRPTPEAAAAQAADLEAFTQRVLSELARDRRPVSTIDPRVLDLLRR
jgi:hypothetical protein